jgi:type II secretory pathway component GspD/PulD (secretin)
VALAAGLLSSGSAVAQTPSGSDLLEQYRNRNAVAAQQLENDLRDALVEAQRLVASDPAKAVECLQRALARVEDDKVLTPTRRDSLVRDIKERIRVARTDTRRADQARAEKVEATTRSADRRASAEREVAEQEKVHELLNNVRALRRDGKADEANRLAQDLAARYPSNLAVQVAAQTGSMADRVGETRQMRVETERRRLLVFQDVDRSAMLPIGDIEFPKDWAAKTKMRKAAQNPMTAKERAILESLDKSITFNVQDAKLYEVIDQLSDLLKQPIVLDDEALKGANVSEDAQVTSRARRPVAARTVLRTVLGQLDLTYVIKDQSIYVTTKEKAKQLMVVRTYYLGDLVGSLNPGLPPALNQLQMAQNVATIVDMVKRMVDPDSWAENGRDGLGTVAFDPLTMSLVVRQSAEVHFLLGGSLR